MHRVQRRRFLIVVAAVVVSPATGQTSRTAKVPRIGYLMFNDEVTGRHILVAFRERLRGLGWIDGQSIILEPRWAEGEVERLPSLAAAPEARRRRRAQAVLVLTDAMFVGERRRIVELTRINALPAMFSQREFVDAGGLVSYGPSLVEMARRAASHVDKILRGARPGEVPVEQPTTFELVINAKAASALGVAIPQSLLLRADQVIE